MAFEAAGQVCDEWQLNENNMMKTLLSFLVVCLLARSAMASGCPGTVLLSNKSSSAGINAPFYDYQAIPLAGPSYVAQLYWGTEETSLSPIGDAVPFKINGYFVPQVRNLPNMAGFPAWVQVRAWEVAGGNSYEEAKDAGVYTGVSNVLYLPRTGDPCRSTPTVPADLIGLKYMGIPEPSTYALLAMGACALGWLVRSRRSGG
jgi:hypothetical protein